MFSTRSSPRCRGASTSPAGSRSNPASRTANACAISSRKCAAPTATSNTNRAPSPEPPQRVRYTARPFTAVTLMDRDSAIDFHAYPDASGHFGRHGGRFVAETLIGPLEELAAAYDAARVDPVFVGEFERDLAHYVGRPSPIYFAERLTREAGGARILLKREDLNHTGAHKINNTIGQALLA